MNRSQVRNLAAQLKSAAAKQIGKIDTSTRSFALARNVIRQHPKLMSALKGAVQKSDQSAPEPPDAPLSPLQELQRYYLDNYDDIAIDPNMVLYEVTDGQAVTDSPFAICQYLISDPRFANLTHYWVLKPEMEASVKAALPAELRSKINFVQRDTWAYADALLKAKHLINNATFQDWFVKRPGQIYINTWHGTPLKKMGFDTSFPPSQSANVIRNFLMADYLLSPNQHTTKMFTDAYKLNGIYQGTILEGGLPRIDFTLKADAAAVRNRLLDSGVELDENKPIVLWAPTRRDSFFGQRTAPSYWLQSIRVLRNRLHEQYNVLLKVHPFLYPRVRNKQGSMACLVPDFFDMNELLAVTDILVTDYSSTFYDYLVRDKLIVFFTPDARRYGSDRGWYFPATDLPGVRVSTLADLVSALQNAPELERSTAAQREAVATAMTSDEDGEVTKRYVERIFAGVVSDKIREYQVADPQKHKLLVYPGAMLANGVTSSFINLMNSIDFDRYDVTALVDGDTDNLAKLPKQVRVLERIGTPVRDNCTMEMRRLVPEATFDAALDFDGYFADGGRLILAANAKKHLVWQHNNLWAEAHGKVNDEYPLLTDLTAMFQLYPEFDELVSVSPATMEVNRQGLREYVRNDQIRFALNTLDYRRVIEQGNDPIGLHKLFDFYGKRVPFDHEHTNYITSGRLSPEKNHAALIDAFVRLVKVKPDSRLYILGQGPLIHDLHEQIRKLNLTDHVFLLGHQKNPFALMKHCDIFVFPSLFEGQGMVLLEAFTLGLKVMASDIPSSRYVLANGAKGILAPGTDADALYQGLVDVTEHGFVADFDPAAYNQSAIAQFDALFANHS
jgi:CDP-glycerol glycerophosphotransferase (TagB/SpsB family)/glycosyltransferase involved in cell wall biosynthesis